MKEIFSKERLIYTLTQGTVGRAISFYCFMIAVLILSIRWEEPLGIAFPLVMIVLFWVMNFFMYTDYKKEGW